MLRTLSRLDYNRVVQVLRSKLKEELNNFDLNFTLCENSVRSFCNLTIFPGRKSEMMSTCKGRALEEGGMMNSSVAQG